MKNGSKIKSVPFIVLFSVYTHTHTITGHFIRYTLLVHLAGLDLLLPSELPYFFMA